MAELLVRVVDKVNPNFYKNVQCTKRGDVITIQPDGWPWGLRERDNPDWRILTVPAARGVDLSALTVPEPDVDAAHPSKTLQRRAFKLDLDSPLIDAALRAYLVDDKRKDVSFETSQLTLDALTVTKAKIIDPNILGDSPNVIG